MNVSRLEIVNALGHAKSALGLPASGIVLVTGPNGAGKSALVEAVSCGVWGKTLRGTPAWRADGSPGSLSVVAARHGGALEIDRARKAGRVTLAWRASGDDLVKYDTPTKAQEALERLVGTWDVWRRTGVFSSADASHFSGATDAERKRLLEEILGLGRFDPALASCRADLRTAEARLGVSQRDADVLRERVRRLRDGLEQAKAALRSLPAPVKVPAAPADLRQKIDRLRQSRAAADRDLAGLQSRLRAAEAGRGAASARVEDLERRLARAQESVCPACGQKVGARVREELERELVAQRGEVAKAVSKAVADADALVQDVKDLEEERRSFDDALNRVQQEVAAADEAARVGKAREALAAQEAEAAARLATAEKELFGAEAALAVATSDVALLGAVEQVLGLRGVRASVLGRSLSGLEMTANARLARLFGSAVSVELRSWSEKKTGGISDAISMSVSGVGDGHGYRAASQGQRRRIDVAMLLALADIAAAAHGARAGTLWMDEVFDALDEEGEGAVCALLPEIAADRCVVVITHSPSLAQRLPATMRVQVSHGGRLTVS